ncbi:alpha-N-acetylglucosaminidase [Streptomyces sp. NPDC051940]|uniref:alpha-N-acetylglucosaminidase n=1 Tax=Streptomyces sp. NPDC051940 TaxID=3155675 RepID=UPI003414D3AF
MPAAALNTAHAVLTRRLGPALAARFGLALVSEAPPGFEVAPDLRDNRTVTVTAATVPDLLAGVRHHVTHHGGGHLGRHGDRLPADLPPTPAPYRRGSPLIVRYAHNPCVTGYSAPYWTWEEWERELDLLALTGYTHVFAPVGQEAVLADFLTAHGYTRAEALAWISLPAHQPWQWMGNLYGFGGGVSEDLLTRRAALGNRIVQRMRRLGITPVMPGFAGYVPADLAARAADCVPVPQSDWQGFDRPLWLDPAASAAFPRLARSWYEAQRRHFGEGRAWSADILHEGGTAGGVDIAAAGERIQRGMLDACPDGLWVVQGWGDNPSKELLSRLDADRLLIVDLNADDTPRWARKEAFWGAPWAFGTISNWGGRGYVFGKLPEIASGPPRLLAAGTVLRGRLTGLAHVPESLESNPVVDELVADMVWRDTPPDLDAWAADYAARRYGVRDPHAERAWRGLMRTAYGLGIGDDVDGSNAGPDSLFNARPDLAAERALPWRPRILPYDAEDFEAAWRELLAASLAGSDAYLHDLVDVTVQVLSNHSRDRLPAVRAAAEAGDVEEFDVQSTAFLDLLDACDRILATRAEFRLGGWLARARRWAAPDAGTPAEPLLYDALSLLTTWGDTRETARVLHDYAARHSAGLVADFYGMRWRRYFAAVREGLAEGRPPRDIDWYAVEEQWSRDACTRPYDPAPEGDTLTVAREIAEVLEPAVTPHDLRLDLAAGPDTPGAARVELLVVNRSATTRLVDRARLTAPWPLRGAGLAPYRPVELPPGGRLTFTWSLTGPAPDDGALEAAVSYDPSSPTTRTVRTTCPLPRGLGTADASVETAR